MQQHGCISRNRSGPCAQSTSLLSFQSGSAGVTDVAWSPHSATVFGCVTASGAAREVTVAKAAGSAWSSQHPAGSQHLGSQHACCYWVRAAGVAEVWDLQRSTLQPVARHVLPEAEILLKEGSDARPSVKAAAARAYFTSLAFSQVPSCTHCSCAKKTPPVSGASGHPSVNLSCGGGAYLRLRSQRDLL